MKKAYLILSLLMMALGISAQEDVKVRFGAQAGFNMTTWGGDYDTKFGTGFKPGFHVGGVAELQIGEIWSVQPELQLAVEGTKTDSIDNVGAIYIKVPLLVYYTFRNVGPGRLCPGIGIYVSGGIGGKTKDFGTFADDSYFRQEANRTREQQQESIKPGDYLNDVFNGGSSEEDLIPDQFDYGLAAKITYELQNKSLNGLYGTLGFSYGLTECKTMNLLFSVGYKFQYSKWLRSTYNTGMLEYNP